MSCNGCRVLRKGCKEDCILRDTLQWIQNPQSQGYATLFVAKFFGRAGLFSFISSVQPHQRSALFQSLLFEAAGRTVNPVSGSTGLLWTGNWKMCQSAVETVLQGGTLSPEYLQGAEIDFFNAPGMTSQIKPNASFQKIETIRAEKVTQETTFENSKRRRVREVALSDESETTTFESSSNNMCSQKNEVKLLRLFV